MAIAIIAVIILGSAGYHFLKGSIIKSFGMLIVALLAAFFAFGYFEMLSAMIISYSAENAAFLIPWAQALSFLLIFALSFSIMQAILVQLTRYEINFGKNAEYIGRILLGVLIGFILSGVCLTFLAMLPLPAKYPYQRFDENNPNAERPNKIILNCDGFISGLFGGVSSGSFSAFKNPRSFAALHPNFIDQLYLNRHGVSENTPITSFGNEIIVPPKNGAFQAPKDLKDTEGNPVEARGSNSLVIVKTGIKKLLNYQSGTTFTLSQVRLLCGHSKEAEKAIVSGGKNIYPLGYLKASQLMQKTKLSEKITLERDDLNEQLSGGQGKWVDFVFEVPNNLTPYAIEFRQNSISAVPTPVSEEKALATTVFIPASQCAKDYAEVSAAESSKIYGLVLTGQTKLLEDLPLSIKDEAEWNRLQMESSIEKARFSEGRITIVQAELKITEADAASTGQAENNLSALLKPLEGYKLLALKCNEPAAGTAISGEQLPVLVEINGRVHHPVGIIAAGKSGEDTLYEIDYCALTRDKNPAGLLIGENGAVAQAFPGKIWITEKTARVTAFYCLYLVKPAEDLFINSVKPADARTGAGFAKFQAFIVR
jgi:hypothetical protein